MGDVASTSSLSSRVRWRTALASHTPLQPPLTPTPALAHIQGVGGGFAPRKCPSRDRHGAARLAMTFPLPCRCVHESVSVSKLAAGGINRQQLS